MTRKDFELIAKAIRESACKVPTESAEYARGCRTQRSVVASQIAQALVPTNPRFDVARFLAACGVEA
jgi:hypothetical protein